MSSGKQFFLLWFRTRLLTCDKHRELSSLIGNQTLSCDRYQAYVLSLLRGTTINVQVLQWSSIPDATLCNFLVDSFLIQRLRFLMENFDSGDQLVQCTVILANIIQQTGNNRPAEKRFNLMQRLKLNLTPNEFKLRLKSGREMLSCEMKWEKEQTELGIGIKLGRIGIGICYIWLKIIVEWKNHLFFFLYVTALDI